MKNKKNGIRYTNDFKEMIGDLYHSGQKVKELSNVYDISEIKISSWLKILLLYMYKLIHSALQMNILNNIQM